MPELPKVPPGKLPKKDGEVRVGGLGTGRVVCLPCLFACAPAQPMAALATPLNKSTHTPVPCPSHVPCWHTDQIAMAAI
jgi:hypothetical protein